MIIAGAAFLAGGAIGGAAVDVYMVIFGRVLLGVGLGFGNQVTTLILICRFNFLFKFHNNKGAGKWQMLEVARATTVKSSHKTQ